MASSPQDVLPEKWLYIDPDYRLAAFILHQLQNKFQISSKQLFKYYNEAQSKNFTQPICGTNSQDSTPA